MTIDGSAEHTVRTENPFVISLSSNQSGTIEAPGAGPGFILIREERNRFDGDELPSADLEEE